MTQTNAATIYAQQNGLKVIKSFLDGLPGKTCCIKKRKNGYILELHVALDDRQALIRNAKREVRARELLGMDSSSTSAPVFVTLTTAQQKEIDSKIFGYDYINL